MEFIFGEKSAVYKGGEGCVFGFGPSVLCGIPQWSYYNTAACLRWFCPRYGVFLGFGWHFCCCFSGTSFGIFLLLMFQWVKATK